MPDAIFTLFMLLNVIKPLHSFRNRKLENITSLSKKIWELKDKGDQYKTEWEIVKKSQKYRIGQKDCKLCLEELILILKEGPRLLNERCETFAGCRHKSAATFIFFKRLHTVE